MSTSKRPAFRAAINSMCKGCIYDPEGSRGTWRQQVQLCTAPDCPLWPIRPVSFGPLPECMRNDLPAGYRSWFDRLNSNPCENPYREEPLHEPSALAVEEGL